MPFRFFFKEQGILLQKNLMLGVSFVNHPELCICTAQVWKSQDNHSMLLPLVEMICSVMEYFLDFLRVLIFDDMHHITSIEICNFRF